MIRQSFNSLSAAEADYLSPIATSGQKAGKGKMSLLAASGGARKKAGEHHQMATTARPNKESLYQRLTAIHRQTEGRGVQRDSHQRRTESMVARDKPFYSSTY